MELAQAAAQPSTVVVKFGAQLASATRRPCVAVGRAHVEQTEWTLVKVWSGGVAATLSVESTVENINCERGVNARRGVNAGAPTRDAGAVCHPPPL